MQKYTSSLYDDYSKNEKIKDLLGSIKIFQIFLLKYYLNIMQDYIQMKATFIKI